MDFINRKALGGIFPVFSLRIRSYQTAMKQSARWDQQQFYPPHGSAANGISSARRYCFVAHALLNLIARESQEAGNNRGGRIKTLNCA
jgi:hypothetical protein